MFQIRWAFKCIGKCRGLWIMGICLSAITSAMLIINPKLSQILIDDVITPQNPDKLLTILGLMLLVQMVRLILRYVMAISLEYATQNMVVHIRRRLYYVLQHEDGVFFRKYTTGDLMTRVSGDLEIIRHTLAWVVFILVDSITLVIAALCYFFAVDPLFTLVMLAVTPVIGILSILFSRRILPIFVEVREQLARLSTRAQENIAGNRVVKAFVREEYECEQFETENDKYRDVNIRAARVWLKFQPMIDFLSQALTLIVVVVGGLFLIGGRLTEGDLLAFSSLTWALFNPMKNLGMLLNDIQRFYTSCNKVIEIYYSQPSIVDKEGAREPRGRIRGKVEFDHVSLTVEGKTILRDVSFSVEPGQTLGIMGPTGSGKSMIARLLARLYETSEGEIRLDGEDISKLTLSSLRSAIGMAPQEVFLFSDTVEGNIRYGSPSLSSEEVQEFARAVDADGFIREMPEGYQTVVGERGVGLSGGQKQRIALARALAMRPSVLVLDDTTSAVDMETEKAIQQQLEQLPFECTRIIIAQRASSVRRADCILVLGDGGIAEKGTHEELLKNNGYYAEIWALQNQLGREVSSCG